MSEDIRRITRQLHNTIERTVRRAAETATRNLADASPRRTGFYASSWVPTTNPDLLDIEPQGDAAGKAIQQEAAIDRLADYNLADGRVFIVNTSGRSAELESRRPHVQDAIDAAVRRLLGS